jgi:hypothetical protein
MITNVVSAVTSIAFFVLIAFAITSWLHLPVGSFTDWLIGGTIFVWLLIVVIVPWNIYFRAKQVLTDGEISQEKGIFVDYKQINFAKVWAGRSLAIALGLHLISATVLYVLALNGVGAWGYWGAVAALLLTILRPIVRAYEYLSARLSQIGEQVKYPREDIVELRNRSIDVEQTLNQLSDRLNLQSPNSWAAQQQELIADLRRQIAVLKAQLIEMQAKHDQDLERVSRESRQAIAQLTLDGQFVEHIREIIRFFKSA